MGERTSIFSGGGDLTGPRIERVRKYAQKNLSFTQESENAKLGLE